MSRVRCEECVFWNNSVVRDPNLDSGRCERHAPKPHLYEMALWPFTDAMDGCGEGVLADGKP